MRFDLNSLAKGHPNRIALNAAILQALAFGLYGGILSTLRLRYMLGLFGELGSFAAMIAVFAVTYIILRRAYLPRVSSTAPQPGGTLVLAAVGGIAVWLAAIVFASLAQFVFSSNTFDIMRTLRHPGQLLGGYVLALIYVIILQFAGLLLVARKIRRGGLQAELPARPLTLQTVRDFRLDDIRPTGFAQLALVLGLVQAVLFWLHGIVLRLVLSFSLALRMGFIDFRAVLGMAVVFGLNYIVITRIYMPMFANAAPSRRKMFGVACLTGFIFFCIPNVIGGIISGQVSALVMPGLFRMLAEGRGFTSAPGALMLLEPLLFAIASQYLSLYLIGRLGASRPAGGTVSDTVPPAADIPAAPDFHFPKASAQRPVTVYALGLLLLLQVVQLVPVFSFVGAIVVLGLFQGLLPHILTVAVIFDVCTKRFPKAVLLLPLAAYGAYALYFNSQTAAIAHAESILAARNKAPLMAFNPETQVLVTQENESLVSTLKVPVVYSPNSGFPEKYFAHRLVSQELCKQFRALKIKWNDGHSPYRYPDGETEFRSRRQLKECAIRRPESPGDRQQLTVTTDSGKETVAGLDINTTTYTFKQDGREIGSYVTGSMQRLPKFPRFHVGCIVLSFSKKECSAGFLPGERVTFNTAPENVDTSVYGKNAIGIMLQIPVYKDSDFENFTDFPENKAMIDKLTADKAAGVEDSYKAELAAQLAALLDAPESERQALEKALTTFARAIRDDSHAAADVALLSRAVADTRMKEYWSLGDAMWQLKDAGVPLAKPMVDRLLASTLPGDREVIKALGNALGALPPGKAAGIGPELRQLSTIPVVRGLGWKALSRLGDSGEDALPVYIDILKTVGTPPPPGESRQNEDNEAAIGAVVGLCKMGDKAATAKDDLVTYLNGGFGTLPRAREAAFELLARFMTDDEMMSKISGIKEHEVKRSRHRLTKPVSKCTY